MKMLIAVIAGIIVAVILISMVVVISGVCGQLVRTFGGGIGDILSECL